MRCFAPYHARLANRNYPTADTHKVRSKDEEASCSPSFVIIILIQRTVQRLTAGYATNSYQSLRMAKRFVRYYWLDTGDGEGASLSVFKDKAGADESVYLAADYVKEHLSKLLVQKPRDYRRANQGSRLRKGKRGSA